MFIRKREGKKIPAVCLGAGHPLEAQLAAEGKLQRRPDGSYLVFTRENGQTGEVAQAGDYVKLDAGGFPYPNDKAFFEENHVAAEEEDRYYQIPRVLEAWSVQEGENDVIRFLLAQNLLKIDENDPAHYFSAFLWGALQTVPQDAVVVFDSVTRADDGTVTAAEFHFIIREEFEAAYLELAAQ